MDAAEAGDQFGAVLTTGDFNGDGYADLAVGVPGEDVGSISDAGAVHVLYGSVSGLTSTWDQLWTQDSPGVPGVAQARRPVRLRPGGGRLQRRRRGRPGRRRPGRKRRGRGQRGERRCRGRHPRPDGPVAYGGGLSTTLLPAQSWTQDRCRHRGHGGGLRPVRLRPRGRRLQRRLPRRPGRRRAGRGRRHRRRTPGRST